MPRQSLPTRIPAIVRSVDSVDVQLSHLVTPSGVLVLIAGAPTLDPFKRIDPSTDDLWVRLATDRVHGETHPRIEFVTRRKPYTTDTTPRRIARSAVVDDQNFVMFSLLGVQMVADLWIGQDPSGDDARNDPLRLIAFVEPASYDWNRYRALCGQFEAERKRSRRPGSDAGNSLPRRRSTWEIERR